MSQVSIEPAPPVIPTTVREDTRRILQSLHSLEASIRVSKKCPTSPEITNVIQYLDPARIPKAATADIDNIEIALVSMNIICSYQIYLGDSDIFIPMFVDTWGDIWKWIVFLYTRCIMPGPTIYGREYCCRSLEIIPRVIWVLGRRDPLLKAMNATPGLLRMITKQWLEEKDIFQDPVIYQHQVAVRATYGIRALDTLLAYLPEDGAVDQVQEVIKYAGGKPEMVASLALKCFQTAMNRTPLDYVVVRCHLNFIIKLASATDQDLRRAFLCSGLVPIFVNALASFGSQPASVNALENSCVTLCFLTIMDSIVVANGPWWTIQALDAGLLPALLTSGPRLALKDHHVIQPSTPLTETLPRYLCFHSVLRSVAKAVTAVDRLDLPEHFFNSSSSAWPSFKAYVTERLSIKDRFDEEFGPLQGCCRPGCDSPYDVSVIKRCTSCLSNVYCKRECQKLDWPTHKQFCKETARMLRDGTQAPLSKHDHEFFLHLIKHDVGHHFNSITKLIEAHPPPTSPGSLILHLGYNVVPLKISLMIAQNEQEEAFVQQVKENQIAVAACYPRGGGNSLFMAVVPRPMPSHV